MLKKCCGEWQCQTVCRDGNFHVTCVKEKSRVRRYKYAQKVVLRFLSEQLYSLSCICSAKILLDWQGVFCCAVRERTREGNIKRRMDKLFPLFQPIQIYCRGRTVTYKNKSRLLKMAFALASVYNSSQTGCRQK
jgi:hypothetical protein